MWVVTHGSEGDDMPSDVCVFGPYDTKQEAQAAAARMAEDATAETGCRDLIDADEFGNVWVDDTYFWIVQELSK